MVQQLHDGHVLEIAAFGEALDGGDITIQWQAVKFKHYRID